jgi:hypothetical protein
MCDKKTIKGRTGRSKKASRGRDRGDGDKEEARVASVTKRSGSSGWRWTGSRVSGGSCKAGTRALRVYGAGHRARYRAGRRTGTEQRKAATWNGSGPRGEDSLSGTEAKYRERS